MTIITKKDLNKIRTICYFGTTNPKEFEFVISDFLPRIQKLFEENPQLVYKKHCYCCECCEEYPEEELELGEIYCEKCRKLEQARFMTI